MKKATVFYLENCPYCRNALRAMKELEAENPAYAGLQIEMVEESREPEKADAYDYYHVPSIFLDGEKVYECSPGEDYMTIRENIRRAWELAGV